MILNVITLAVILVSLTYSQCFSHGHSQSHNHAYSSQSITMYQNHQEPVYYHHPDPYNDKFQETPLNPVEEDDHMIQQNHHSDLSNHRHLYNEQSQDDYPNQYLIHPNDEKPDHRNLYSGQPIVVASGYNEMPLKDHRDHKPMFFKDQNMLFASGYKEMPVKAHQEKQPMSFKYQNLPFNTAKDMHKRPHYNMPNAFEHHEMPVHFNKRKPVRMGSYEHRPHHVNHIPHREYEFNYNIEDKLTGDHKAHHETRNDGVVKGVYSFQEADGSIRIVEYTADAKNGFHAKVRHEGQKHKMPKHHKNYSHRPRYHPQHNNLHPLLFNAPKY